MTSTSAIAPVRANVSQAPQAVAALPAKGMTMQRAGVLSALPTVAHAKPGPLSRPAERALACLAAIHAFTSKPGAESALLDTKVSKDARMALFPLEALLRSAVVRFGGSFEKDLKHVKALEDAIGHHLDAVDRLADMRTFGQPDLINYWAGRQTAQRKLLTDVLTSRWLPHTAGDKAAVSRMVCDFRAAKWGDAATDRDANAAGLFRDASRVVTKQLDMSDLEQVHELRRGCRWYALLARSLGGAITLVDGGAPKEFEHYLTDPASKLEFAQLPPAKAEPNPITLSRALWIGGSYIIDQLGALKAKGETLIAVTEALEKGRGMKHDKAEAEAMKIMKVTKQERAAWTSAADFLYGEAKAVFGAIADQMAAQRTS